jgi:hypothetical protein
MTTSPARLLNADKLKVENASRSAVQQYFTGLAASGGSTFWLDAGNRYRKTATQTFDDDVKANPRLVDESALIAYIAASAPTHLIDGWSYLARATEALLRGDLNAALHLGYYAELRATMSLLASEGIGVFNSRHPIITASGLTTTEIRRIEKWDNDQSNYVSRGAGTHLAVWPLLSHWCTLSRAADLIDSLIAPEGSKLRQWLDALGILTPVAAISEDWFTTWGIDLSNLSDDHDSRNMASYRPSELRFPHPPSAQEAITFISALWTLFEPQPGGRFPQVERELLRKIVRDSGKSKEINAAALQEKLGMDSTTADNWVSYLKGTDDSLPLVLAAQSSDVEDTKCSLQIVSRAALLLFLATGSTRKHFIGAGYSPSMLEFFWTRLCAVRFHGPAHSLPDDPIDLWRDIEDHMKEMKSWSVSATPDASLGEWREVQPSVVNQIVGLELAAVWGLVS